MDPSHHHVLTITDRPLPHHVIDRNLDRQVHQHIGLQAARGIDNHVTGADRTAQLTGLLQDHQQGQCLDLDHLQGMDNAIKGNNGIIAEIDEDEVIDEITISGKYFAFEEIISYFRIGCKTKHLAFDGTD